MNIVGTFIEALSRCQCYEGSPGHLHAGTPFAIESLRQTASDERRKAAVVPLRRVASAIIFGCGVSLAGADGNPRQQPVAGRGLRIHPQFSGVTLAMKLAVTFSM